MKVLVYGWYHQLNIGDELFVDCFHKLFPDFEFVFTDDISVPLLKGVDAIFFGGGSFLGDRPNIDRDALEILKKLPIFYIGVGAEADVYPTHMELIRLARLVATRSLDQSDKLTMLNPNTIWIPDLAYALQADVSISAEKKNRSVLVMPNISVVPHHLDPYWMHTSWMHFKAEFSQFLDSLVEEGYQLEFLAMCQGIKDNDNWTAGEIISQMVHRENYILHAKPKGIKETSELISKYNMVITQRFHGIVLAEMTKTPYMAIHHHDKLKYSYPRSGSFVSYHNISKHLLLDTFNRTIRMKFSDSLPIESNIFEGLSQRVISLL